MPEGLKSVEEVPEWEEIEMAVDSGASESVVSEDMLTRVTTVEGYAQKKGVQYEVADGTLIPNLGEKKFVAASDVGVGPRELGQCGQGPLYPHAPQCSHHRWHQSAFFAAS